MLSQKSPKNTGRKEKIIRKLHSIGKAFAKAPEKHRRKQKARRKLDEIFEICKSSRRSREKKKTGSGKLVTLSCD